MKWVSIKGTHLNTDRVESFYWKDGELVVWFALSNKPTIWEDPDAALYLQMCRRLGVRPDEEVEPSDRKGNP